MEFEISEIGTMVDNTIKTRYIFEINKGTNKNPTIGENASMNRVDRRIPIDRMIYKTDGPSDVPVFLVVKSNGCKAYAVFNPESEAEFAQNDAMIHAGRIHACSPADYTQKSTSSKWLHMYIRSICDSILAECEASLSENVSPAPRHLDDDYEQDNNSARKVKSQKDLF